MHDYEGWTILEQWRPVVSFEGIYEVSCLGSVRRVGKASCAGKGRGGGARIGRLLKPQALKGGYRVVFLWKQGKQYTRLVHVLVAAAFIGPCPEGMEVNHKRGSEVGDAIDNLEYLTHQQNCKHAYTVGLRKPTLRLSLDDVQRAHELKRSGLGSRRIAKVLGCCRQTAQDALREMSNV